MYRCLILNKLEQKLGKLAAVGVGTAIGVWAKVLTEPLTKGPASLANIEADRGLGLDHIPVVAGRLYRAGAQNGIDALLTWEPIGWQLGIGGVFEVRHGLSAALN